MTDEQAASTRQQAIAHVNEVRKGVDPQTTEHIAEAAREAASPEMRAYAEFLGWKEIKRLSEDAGHAQYRPTRSGHKNRSGKFEALTRTILDTWYSVDGISKQLGELTMEELSAVIDNYDRRGHDLLAERDRLQRVYDAGVEKGAKRVKQLGAKRVESLYREEAIHA